MRLRREAGESSLRGVAFDRKRSIGRLGAVVEEESAARRRMFGDLQTNYSKFMGRFRHESNSEQRRVRPGQVWLTTSDVSYASAVLETQLGDQTARKRVMNRSAAESSAESPSRRQLWVDGVGGFLLLTSPDVLIGQATPQSGVDIPILGDVSRRHAWIRRRGSEYVVDPLGEVRRRGRRIEQASVLEDGDLLQLGRSLVLSFQKRHPLSASAVLRIESSQRTEPSSDGILLMAETCILGPRRCNHVVCGGWKKDVVLYKQGESLHVRSPGTFLVNGDMVRNKSPLSAECSVQGEEFSFYMERMAASA
ncbi:MAG: FHA domain-containing protein [Blastopirellula sp. JB062]